MPRYNAVNAAEVLLCSCRRLEETVQVGVPVQLS